ncbi:MAG: hypothetical protein GOV01_02765 [Candidatus Altiarchaeota archaeon]|nr:hypothetical protein [Candidatus Altiarchaeota archaeon]
MTVLWEVSFECGNKVGGIWTVITSKSAFMQKHFGNNYFTIGFYNSQRTEIVQKTPPKFLATAFSKLKKKGIEFKYGSWVDANDSNIILVNAKKFMGLRVDEIKSKFWEEYQIDSLGAGHDYDEPLAWSYAIGMLLEEVSKLRPDKHIVQLHEWLSAGTLLYIHSKGLKLPTVFTTHATVLGRAMGGSAGVTNPEENAKESGVTAKHLLEKAAAKYANIFTTVSDSTGDEAEKILGRKPDVLTYNAMGSHDIPDLAKLMNEKVGFRKKIDDFVRSYFFPYYPLNLEDYPVIYTAGRYEFFNKGYDLFIDALGKINERLKQDNYPGWFLSFILVPAGTLGVKEEVNQNFAFYRRMKEVLKEDIEKMGEDLYSPEVSDLTIEKRVGEIMVDFKKMKARLETRRGKKPPLCAFQLSENEANDAIIKRLIENGLLNRVEDRVKVVYYPIYINKQDDLLGLRYKDFLTAASMGVFLSRYEPWGYTPMEAAAYLSAAVTTNTAGFGMVTSKLKNSEGIHVADISKGCASVEKIIEDFVKSDKEARMSLEIGAHKTVKKNFIWDKLGERYIRAYSRL